MDSGGQDSLDRAKLGAINQQTALGTQLAGTAAKADARNQKAFDKTFPFFTDRMEHGLPYFDALTDQQGGLVHQAFAPQYGAMERRLSNMGDLPSGFAEASREDMQNQEARTFDQQLLNGLGQNEQAKEGGAAGLSGQLQINNPLGYYSAATGAQRSVIGAPNFPQDNSTQAINGAISGAMQGLTAFF